jgi:two-component system, NtrC family, response regulator HydG
MLNAELDSYWKTVVDTIQDAVMIVDTGGIIVAVNRSFETITGYQHNDIIGQSCAELNCNSCAIVREKNGCHFCLMFEKGTLRKQKCLLRRKGGGYVHVVKNASVLKDPQGNITGAVETMTDITDLIEKETQIETYRRELREEDRFHGMIGASAAMQKVFELITNAAQSDAPVIIYGESGTGKELVARAIHEIGPLREKPYVTVNCAALNASLLESELFGHVKGAFTGAHRSRAGRFEAAAGGDIFLDEIGDLPLDTQVKLLRVLEEKAIERVGDNRSIGIDVRVISATNRDLPRLIGQKKFREDFFYRINVIPIWVPPLRERASDVPLLAEAFFRRIRLKSGKKIASISNAALELLMHYSWPGNIRELKSAFEYAIVACSQTVIEPEHFPPGISGAEPPFRRQPESSTNLNQIKKQRLEAALQKTGGNQSEAARILGISRTSVWSQMKRFNLRAS